MRNAQRFFLFKRDNRNIRLVVRFPAKSHSSVSQRIQRMISAHSDIQAGVMHRTALANQNRAGFTSLSTEQFNA